MLSNKAADTKPGLWVFDRSLFSPEVLEDYISELYDLHEHMGHDLGVLESNPTSINALSDLIKSIGTLKRRSHELLLEPVEVCLAALEIFNQHLLEEQMPCSLLVKEVIFLALDQVKFSAKALVKNGQADVDTLNRVRFGFEALSGLTAEEIDERANNIIKMISGIELNCFSQDMALTQPLAKVGSTPLPPLSDIDQPRGSGEDANQVEKDLEFFEILAGICDLKVSFWRGRTGKILELALGVNEQLAMPIEIHVLKAAVFTHDVGMAFIPEHILNMRRKLNAMEESRIRAHARLGYEMLMRMERWQSVAEIVLQHHERIDGTGYPNQLRADEISLGAKILAVCDAYVSITNNRPDRSCRHSVLRGAKEINLNAGSQFDPVVVDAFNQYLRKAYASGSL